MRFAMAQINTVVGDFENNAKKILSFSWDAFKKGAEVIIFPELCLCGYPPEDLLLKKAFIKEEMEIFEKIIPDLPEALILFGLAYLKDNQLYNSCAIIFKREFLGVYNKINLPNYGVFDEKRYFIPGSEAIVLQINDTNIGVQICEDIWIENSTTEAQSFLGNAEVIVNISSSPYHMGKSFLREEIIKRMAKKVSSAILYCNLIGGQDELVFDGGSFFVDEEGNILAKAKRFEEDLLILDIDTNQICQRRLKNSEFKERKKEFPRTIPIETMKLGKIDSEKIKKGEVIKGFQMPMELEEEVYNALKLGLWDYLNKNGFKNVILGLSGGIDSALVATIAKDSLGSENVKALFMPSRYTLKESYELANTLSNNLKIEMKTISIEKPFDSLLNLLSEHFKGLPFNETEENIQARIRGLLLMAFSNKFGYLVLSTGNKSEYSVGYCTLYGDMVGGFALLKDVPKTLVYKIAKWRNKKEGYDLIPMKIITREPTAELKENQKDQDSLPPYEILDKIIHHYIEEDLSTQEIIEKGFEKEVVYKVIKAIDNAEYKRRQAPPGIKITPKAFGKDRRMPITHKYILF